LEQSEESEQKAAVAVGIIYKVNIEMASKIGIVNRTLDIFTVYNIQYNTIGGLKSCR
jgi:hypothetical protein